MDKNTYFMRKAIEIARLGITTGNGPFGAIVVKNDVIIGSGSNSVVNSTDPTAHAEIVAIRKACDTLKTHVLEGSVIYSSCEPCPMCLAAIWWARIDKIFYGSSRLDAQNIGFDDNAIYKEIASPLDKRSLPIQQILKEEAQTVFRQWANYSEKTMY